MANATRRSGSLETLRCKITAGGKDPTGDTVRVGVTTDVHTSPATFATASWDPESGVYWVKFQVGPGSGIGQLAQGVYYVIVKITDAPDAPELTADGTLTIV